ncbi:hypothetical protein DFP72DRAFT_1065375 [Ephemerocybe angulata]|uniref:Uncharacterized protein n=1 Tax=Ephemerocybe angulata TaxID=980116 RepID=A0A8H6MAL6_9AGAR|nr:hypothetical protein DFP72DRAFT_1065375 [Tulosesus angulatus]
MDTNDTKGAQSQGSVAEQLARAQAQVDKELERLEEISITGAALGPRYPKLLHAKQRLAETIMKLEAAEFQQSSKGTESAESTGLAELEPQALLRLLNESGILNNSPANAGADAGGALQKTETDEAILEAALQSYERVLGHTPHPSEMAFGMVPDQRTREVWASIPRDPKGGEGGADGVSQ